jgi:uncharacterized protein YjbJ (UPF0337 family)
MKNTDQIKGRIREAAGEKVIGDLREKAADTLDSLKDKIHQLTRVTNAQTHQKR